MENENLIKEEKRSFLRKIPGFRSGKKWKIMVASLFYGFWILVFIGIANSDTSTQQQVTKQEQKVEQLQQQEQSQQVDSQQKEEEEETIEAQKQAVLDFEKQFFNIEKPTSLALQDFSNKAGKLGQGVTVYDLYEAANKAKNACKNTQMIYTSLKIPDNIPDDVKKILKDAKSDLSTAYYSKSIAMDKAMKFLDEQKPSQMQEYKDEIKMADSFVINGVLKLTEAKQKIGIDISK